MINKLLSGRYFLTVCCGIVFVYCAITKVLDAIAVGIIITGVFKDYFNRNDRQNQKGEV